MHGKWGHNTHVNWTASACDIHTSEASSICNANMSGAVCICVHQLAIHSAQLQIGCRLIVGRGPQDGDTCAKRYEQKNTSQDCADILGALSL